MIERFLRPATLLEKFDAAPPAEQRAIVVDLIERHRVLTTAAMSVLDALSLPELEVAIRGIQPALAKSQERFPSERDVGRVV